ncbi:MAG: hypothetical protein JNL98_12275 [Bryobacterales bacterium]|nr:hypothetical protein [Bryobacterales bacterium]
MQLFTRTSHLTERALQMYSQGELMECGELEEHLEECAYCRKQLVEVKRFLSVLGTATVVTTAGAMSAQLASSYHCGLAIG